MTRKSALKKLCGWAERQLNGCPREWVLEIREAICIVSEALNEPPKPKQGDLFEPPSK